MQSYSSRLCPGDFTEVPSGNSSAIFLWRLQKFYLGFQSTNSICPLQQYHFEFLQEFLVAIPPEASPRNSSKKSFSKIPQEIPLGDSSWNFIENSTDVLFILIAYVYHSITAIEDFFRTFCWGFLQEIPPGYSTLPSVDSFRLFKGFLLKHSEASVLVVPTGVQPGTQELDQECCSATP